MKCLKPQLNEIFLLRKIGNELKVKLGHFDNEALNSVHLNSLSQLETTRGRFNSLILH